MLLDPTAKGLKIFVECKLNMRFEGSDFASMTLVEPGRIPEDEFYCWLSKLNINDFVESFENNFIGEFGFKPTGQPILLMIFG